jgi:hypothetical protein
MRVNEIKGYEHVKPNYTIVDGVLMYNGKPTKTNVVKTMDGLAIEIELDEVKEKNKIEVWREGRLFYTLDKDLKAISDYLHLPFGKFKTIYRDGLKYRGYTFKEV